MFFRRKDSGSGREFRTGDPATNGARRNRYTRIVANSLALAHIAASHDVEFPVLFSEPDRRGNADAGFAERGERYVFLISNFRGNLTWHKRTRSVQVSHLIGSLSSVVRSERRRLLPSCHLCYKPEHA